MSRLLLTLLTFLALAAPAAAQTVRHDYKVVIDGRGYYNHAAITPTEWGDQPMQEDDEWTFRTEGPTVSFFDSVGMDFTGTTGSAAGVRGHIKSVNPNGTTLECSGSEVTDYTPGVMDGIWAPGSMTYEVRVMEAVQLLMRTCNHPVGDGYPKRFDSLGAPLGSGLFDSEFTVPASMIGSGQMQFPLSGKVIGPKCPGHDEETTQCELSWEATVTFTRIGGGTVSDEVVPVPLVPDPPKPAVAPPPAKPRAAVEALGDQAKLTASAVTVPVRCATGCSGVATVELAGGAKAAAKRKPLATKRFTIKPGRTVKVKIKLPKRTRKARAVRVTLKITPRGGKAATHRVTVRR